MGGNLTWGWLGCAGWKVLVYALAAQMEIGRLFKKAAVDGDVGELRRMVTLGVGVNVRGPGGCTALHQAAGYGHMEALKALVELGADMAAKDNCGGTPLHVGAFLGQVEAMKVLVEQLGADMEATADDGQTPLHLAAYNGQVEAIKLLAELEAELEAKTAYGRTPP